MLGSAVGSLLERQVLELRGVAKSPSRDTEHKASLTEPLAALSERSLGFPASQGEHRVVAVHEDLSQRPKLPEAPLSKRLGENGASFILSHDVQQLPLLSHFQNVRAHKF